MFRNSTEHGKNKSKRGKSEQLQISCDETERTVEESKKRRKNIEKSLKLKVSSSLWKKEITKENYQETEPISLVPYSSSEDETELVYQEKIWLKKMKKFGVIKKMTSEIKGEKISTSRIIDEPLVNEPKLNDLGNELKLFNEEIVAPAMKLGSNKDFNRNETETKEFFKFMRYIAKNGAVKFDLDKMKVISSDDENETDENEINSELPIARPKLEELDVEGLFRYAFKGRKFEPNTEIIEPKICVSKEKGTDENEIDQQKLDHLIVDVERGTGVFSILNKDEDESEINLDILEIKNDNEIERDQQELDDSDVDIDSNTDMFSILNKDEDERKTNFDMLRIKNGSKLSQPNVDSLLSPIVVERQKLLPENDADAGFFDSLINHDYAETTISFEQPNLDPQSNEFNVDKSFSNVAKSQNVEPKPKRKTTLVERIQRQGKASGDVAGFCNNEGYTKESRNALPLGSMGKFDIDKFVRDSLEMNHIFPGVDCLSYKNPYVSINVF